MTSKQLIWGLLLSVTCVTFGYVAGVLDRKITKPESAEFFFNHVLKEDSIKVEMYRKWYSTQIDTIVWQLQGGNASGENGVKTDNRPFKFSLIAIDSGTIK